MTALLANLLHEDNPALRELARHMNDSRYAAPHVALILLSVLALLGAGYILWDFRRRQMRRPGGRALLRRVGDTVGIDGNHRRLLWRLGRAAAIEPAAALVSPAMLMELIHRIERRGIELTAPQAARIAEILDAVTAAAGDPVYSPGAPALSRGASRPAATDESESDAPMRYPDAATTMDRGAKPMRT